CAVAMRMMADGFVLKSASMGSPGVEEVRWLRPVRPSDSLTMRASVVETRPSGSRPGMGLIKFSYEMLDQSDNCVMTLVSTMVIARRGFTPASAMASQLVSRFRGSPEYAARSMRTSESKDTSKLYDSSAALNPKFAIGLAAMSGELRVRGTDAMKYFEDIAVGERASFGSHTFTAGELKTFAHRF